MAIAAAAPGRFVLLGTEVAEDQGVQSHLNLDDDAPLPGGELEHTSAADCLHYVPLHHAGVRQRVAKSTAWIAAC